MGFGSGGGAGWGPGTGRGPYGVPWGTPGGTGGPGSYGERLVLGGGGGFGGTGPGGPGFTGTGLPGLPGKAKTEGLWKIGHGPVGIGGPGPGGGQGGEGGVGAGEGGGIGDGVGRGMGAEGPVGLGAGHRGPNIPGLLVGAFNEYVMPALGGALGTGTGEGPGTGVGGAGYGFGKGAPRMARGPLAVPGGTGLGFGIGTGTGAGAGAGPGLGTGGPVGFGLGAEGGQAGGIGLPRLPSEDKALPVSGIAGLGPGGGGVGAGLVGDAAKAALGGLYANVSGSFDMPMGVTTADYQADAQGMRNLLAEVRERTNVHVTVQERFVPLTLDNIRNTPLLHLRGHRPFSLTDQERETLRQYVAQGGTIFGEDSHGPFGECFEREMKKIFGKAPEDLPLEHDLYRARYVLDRVPAGDMGERYPLQGIDVGGRLGVIFSRNDYGDCWEGTGEWVRPESREPAFEMGTNIFIYVTAHWKKAQERGGMGNGE